MRRPHHFHTLSLAILVAGSLSMTPVNASKPTYAHKMEMGQLLFFNGDIDRSIKAFKDASELNDKAFEPHLNLVNLYVQKGGDEGLANAANECAEVLKRKPNNKDVHLILGNLLRTQAGNETDPDKMKQKLAEAEKEVETAMEMGASKAMCENTIGLIDLQLGNNSKALEHINNALEKQPVFADAHLVRAVLLFKDMVSKVEAHGQDTTISLKDLNSDDAKAKVEQVMKELDLSIKQKEKNAEAHNTKADILFAQSKHEEALKEYRKASEDEPKYAQAWAGIGNTLAQMMLKDTDSEVKEKHLREAKDAYAKARRLKPNDKNIGYGLALMLEKLGLLDEARSEFQSTLMIEEDPLMRAQIQLHVQQMGGGSGLGSINTHLGGGGFGAGAGTSGMGTVGNGLFTSGALSQPFKDLIKIKAPPGQLKEKKETD